MDMSGFQIGLVFFAIVAFIVVFKYFQGKAKERSKMIPKPTKGERPKRGE